ncbi:MAG: YeeE/YedE family protein [Sphingobacteriales bacterium]|nr:YeeE/YedE family protein [Sphingobacteriales bacterium]
MILEFIKQPLPWYVAGILIGLTVPTLLLIGNKTFGISSSLRHVCAACMPAKIPFFSYNWKDELWNLFFVIGVLLGGLIGTHFLTDSGPIEIASETKAQLSALGVKDFSGLMPLDIFGVDQIFSLTGLIFMVFGGFLIGFGSRYAGGCTSGHAIMGLSNLQWPSLVATISFMVGGFISTWILLPYIFKLIA